jgi:hypothetical protein
VALDPSLNALYQAEAHRPGDRKSVVERIAALEARVTALERAGTFVSFTGAPGTAPPDGAGGIQTDTPKLWLRVAGAWRFTTLT